MKQGDSQGVMSFLSPLWSGGEDASPPQKSTLELIEEARREWLEARSYFDSVVDPDLVEHAVYVSQAAEKRYTYLLKQARAEGIMSAGLREIR